MTTKLVDQYGRPIDLGVLTQEVATVSLASVRTAWYQSQADSLTPQRLGAILAGVAQNNILDYLTLAEEMEERDLHYASVLRTRKLAVAQLKPVVEARTDATEDVKVAEAVQDLVDDDAFGQLVMDQLDALGRGFAVSEIMWDTSEQQWEPREYKRRDQRHFQFDLQTGDELRLRDAADGANGLALPGCKFVQHRPRLKTGLAIRGGLARLAVVAYMCKGYALKDWLAFAEVFGMPLRVGKYATAATDEQKAALLTAVANIGTDAAAIIPESMIIDFISADKSGGGDKLFKALADYLDSQVSKGVLGQTMTTDNGSSLSQAQVHNQVREDIKASDALQLAVTLRRDLVKPYVDLNFGVRKPREYPILRFATEEKEDLKLLAEALSPFIDRGLKVEASVIRDKFGLPEPEEGAELLGAKAVSQPFGVGGQPGGDGEAQPPVKQQDGEAQPPAKPQDGQEPPDDELTDEEQPAGLKGAARALARRVLAGEELTDDQRRLLALAARQPDDTVDELAQNAAEAVHRAMHPLLEPIEALAARCRDPEQFVEELGRLELSSDELVKAIASLTFRARGLGDATDKP